MNDLPTPEEREEFRRRKEIIDGIRKQLWADGRPHDAAEYNRRLDEALGPSRSFWREREYNRRYRSRKRGA